MSFIQFKRRITEPAGEELDLRDVVRAADPTPVEDIDDDAFARAIEEGRRREGTFNSEGTFSSEGTCNSEASFARSA
jgi:hypothetical protein